MILFIDDEVGAYDSLIGKLEEQKLLVKKFFKLGQGLEWLENHKQEVELIILDIRMPTEKLGSDVNAREAGIWGHREIRKILPQVPILIYTVVKRTVMQQVNDDNTYYLEKPCLIRQVLQQVDNILKPKS